MMQKLHDLHLAGEIEKGGRLIQEDYRRFLCQRFGDHDLLPLTVGKGVYHARGEVLDPDGSVPVRPRTSL